VFNSPRKCRALEFVVCGEIELFEKRQGVHHTSKAIELAYVSDSNTTMDVGLFCIIFNTSVA